MYDELVRLHQEEGLSFKNVVTFNLDEYFPMQPHELQSYVRFMNEHLFDHIDIPKENVHIPDGTLPIDEVPHYCEAYEKAIDEAGGIDLQILGIGRTGHIGFNEPGSARGQPHAPDQARPADAPWMRPAISSARRTCPAAPSPWAWARSSSARRVILHGLRRGQGARRRQGRRR